MRVEELIAEAFGLALRDVEEGTSPDSLEAWDSLAHVNLLLQIEEAYGVSLSADDALEMRSVGAIRRILASHGVRA